MGLFRRLFSVEYRRALTAEAAGDFLAAAKSYALCGEQAKVAQMHQAQAAIEQTSEAKVRQLQTALAFAPQDTPLRAAILRQLGTAQADRAREIGPATLEGRRILAQAAAHLEQGEACERAGEIWLELKQPDKAAAAFAKAGLVDRVEQILSAEEESHGRRRREDGLFKDYELLLQGGQRDQARAALRGCIEAAEHKGEYRRLLGELEDRRLASGQVTLDLGRRRITLAGTFPLWLGRDPDCQLQVRGHSVSRRHARVLRTADGFVLEDAGSHNGTLLSGMRLGAAMPLPPSGTIGLGDGCVVGFSLLGSPAGIQLEVQEGLDAGKLLLASDGQCDLAVLLEGAPPLLLWFDGDRPMARAHSGVLTLNGARTAGPIQLIRDDVVQLDGQQLKVVG